MAEDVKELMRRFVGEAWNQGKLEVVDQLVAPGCVHAGEQGEPARGAGSPFTWWRWFAMNLDGP